MRSPSPAPRKERGEGKEKGEIKEDLKKILKDDLKGDLKKDLKDLKHEKVRQLMIVVSLSKK